MKLVWSGFQDGVNKRIQSFLDFCWGRLSVDLQQLTEGDKSTTCEHLGLIKRAGYRFNFNFMLIDS